MTHTLHRVGTEENLQSDFVVFSMSAKGINEKGSFEKMQEFLRILCTYKPNNLGDMKTGNMYIVDREEIITKVKDTSIVHGVFTDSKVVTAILKELKERDLGVSVVVSGLHKTVEGCCREAGLKRHTIEHSLGIWGRRERLPEREILEITTMCGHGMVPASLVRKMLIDIKTGRKTLEEAALELTKPCQCGIVNKVRVEKILGDLLPLWCLNQV